MKYWIILIPSLLMTGSLPGQVYLPEKNYKARTASEILINISNAYGSGMNVPRLMIKSKKDTDHKYIATFIPGDNPAIIIDEEVYDICAGYGTDSLNALASLIGHEASHHFEKHNFCSDFAFVLGNDHDLTQKIRKTELNEKVRYEAEADFYGCFYGYVAGYNTYKMLPGVLDKIYTAYGLPDNVEGYPSKTERKEIAMKSYKDIEPWITVFEAGMIFALIKEYESAQRCFDYLAGKFPSREIINNSAVISLLEAVDLYKYDEFPFILPIEFDAETRLRTGESRSGINDMSDEQRNNERYKKAESAIMAFDQAVSRDPFYTNAKINKACAYIILENYNMALGLAQEAEKETNLTEADKSGIFTLQGLAYYFMTEPENAGEAFEKALSMDKSILCRYNLRKFNDLNKSILEDFMNYIGMFYEENNEQGATKQTPLHPDYEKVHGTEVSSLKKETMKSCVVVSGKPDIVIYFDRKESNNMYLFQFGDEVLRVIRSTGTIADSTYLGIRINDQEQEIRKKYGNPSYMIGTTDGFYLAYRKRGILFHIDSAGKLDHRMVYIRQ
ncbi:MAG: hypothetical protein KJ607_08475 [Bacteroidetes bacterium]|nr:hypothetical protein [Bacteroidota bacterium]